MKVHLFRFGYCTPRQWAANEANGWDDESSSAFLVRAESADDALSWGCEVADKYVSRQFELEGWTEIPSWKASGFASWIEDDPAAEFPDGVEGLPVVACGVLPNFDKWEDAKA